MTWAIDQLRDWVFWRRDAPGLHRALLGPREIAMVEGKPATGFVYRVLPDGEPSQAFKQVVQAKRAAEQAFFEQLEANETRRLAA